jgi:arabinose-5-phosphate isomerase
VRDAVLAMTQARAGSAAVTDGDLHLEGILTDGDLRRGLSEQADLLSQPVALLMTKAPLSVRQDELAVDVLRVFEKHDIDDLPVVDDQNRVVGAVDIVDLPKVKVM